MRRETGWRGRAQAPWRTKFTPLENETRPETIETNLGLAYYSKRFVRGFSCIGTPLQGATFSPPTERQRLCLD